MDFETINDLFAEIEEKKCSIKDAINNAVILKYSIKSRLLLLSLPTVKIYEVAEKHPDHTTAERLEPFKELDFSNSRKLPDRFLKVINRPNSTYLTSDFPKMAVYYTYV